MFERAPNGFFVRNLIVFNLLRRGGYVAKGFVFEAPTSPIARSPTSTIFRINSVSCRLASREPAAASAILLRFRLQGNCCAYQQETEKFSNVWTIRTRNERFARYWQAMSERKLAVSASLSTFALAGKRPKSFQSAAAGATTTTRCSTSLKTEFDHVHRLLPRNLRLRRRAHPADE